ncbi:hypothetical protein DUI87_10577 [Hirundo rustica rustica]|uniref:Uncharacterized protein n=1 Tax=Hirundo rustica rustica TaxID=333673 RepID=A0A3M0L0X6_HIRRU|nr:hypothetical protein DUI87_10577 [Hirundo rustica rustica]
MTDVEPVVTDFAASGRAGRRNALPDILGSPAGAGTSDLPHKLAELSVSEAQWGPCRWTYATGSLKAITSSWDVAHPNARCLDFSERLTFDG